MYFQGDAYEICSLLRIYKLGGYVIVDDDEWTEQGVGEEITDDPDERPPTTEFDTFTKELRNLCAAWDDKIRESAWWDWYSMHSKYVPKMVIEAVTATPGQGEIEGYLRQIGFKSVGPISKIKHSETALTFWVMSGDDFCKSIGYVCEYDPRNNIQKEEVSSAA